MNNYIIANRLGQPYKDLVTLCDECEIQILSDFNKTGLVVRMSEEMEEYLRKHHTNIQVEKEQITYF